MFNRACGRCFARWKRRSVFAGAITALGLSFLCVSAHADGSGLYLSLGVGLRSTTGSVQFPSIGSSADVGETNLAGDLTAGWMLGLGDYFSLAIGAFFQPSTGDAQISAGSLSATFRQHNRYGLVLEPGFTLGEEGTTLYFKLSYSAAKSEIAFSDGTSSSENVMGPGLGAGIRYFFGDHMFMYTEFEYARYSSKSYTIEGTEVDLSKPTNATGLLGLGYRF